VEKIKPSVEDVFARLAEYFPAYEHRPQQIEFALAVEHSIKTGKPGIFEAGTGTGKTLAALIPAALSGQKVVISSATISLQEQYINKDIPTLKAILPFDIKAVLLKGRGNYLGLRRYHDHILQQELDPRIPDWAVGTTAGDVAELDFVPVAEQWTEINSDSDDCLRVKCPTFNECHYFKAKREAEKADILVVNHALLLIDAISGGNVLPPYDILVIDEAHQLPEVATKAFSVGMSNRGVAVFCSRALKNVNAPAYLVHNVEELSQEFFQRLSFVCNGGKTRLRKPVDGMQELHAALVVLQQWLEQQEFPDVLEVDNQREKMKLKARKLISTVASYIQCLDLLSTNNPDWVFWAEKQDGFKARIELMAAPLTIDQFINNHIFSREDLQTSIWMSATLATAGSDPFRFFKQQVGAPNGVIQAKIASPFDYKRQSILYLPRNLPEPNSRDFTWQACEEINDLLHLSNGRAFVLFTSYNAMNAAYESLHQRLPFESKKQGDMPRKKLIEWFRTTPNAVLFATASFWEGVSVDGDQLSCVIIDRIPFQSPDDPVYEARCEAMQEDQEKSWFNDLALPYAIMRLKQGVGRLIRTRSDRGIVAILDPRITQKRYGRTILESLPPMRVEQDLQAASSFEDLLAPGC
jgi:ATP-dependent DNA helicase DinG